MPGIKVRAVNAAVPVGFMVIRNRVLKRLFCGEHFVPTGVSVFIEIRATWLGGWGRCRFIPTAISETPDLSE